MSMFYFSISLTIVSNVLYHVFQKLTPRSVNPFISLAATYALAMTTCFLLGSLFNDKGLLQSLRQLNWASFALAFAIVGLELGFLLAYRAGWNISLGAIVSNVAVALVLLPLGVLCFREKLSPVNVIGIVVCIVGLVMVNYQK